MVKRKQQKQNKSDWYQKAIYFFIAVIAVESFFLIASCQKKVERPSLSGGGGQKVKITEAPEPKPQKPQPKKPFTQEEQKGQGRIAIVLDDWGYSVRNLDFVTQISEPLTLAILPNHPYSSAVAKAAIELKKEAILHLPLEPHQENKYHLEPDTILSALPKAEVLKILASDIKSVPGIKGVNNHMGSAATENKPLMKVIFYELKKRKLYFLDSFTGKTVCKELAKEIGLLYARRQVFLDNKNEPSYILGQIELLAKIAKQTGYAIGIGHDRPKTLEVLVKAIPDLKRRGYSFVFASDLAN